MRAVEFQTKITNNAIAIPNTMLAELQYAKNKNIRVVVFMEDSDVYDNKSFRKITKKQFLKGYAETDAIYDL